MTGGVFGDGARETNNSWRTGANEIIHALADKRAQVGKTDKHPSTVDSNWSSIFFIISFLTAVKPIAIAELGLLSSEYLYIYKLSFSANTSTTRTTTTSNTFWLKYNYCYGYVITIIVMVEKPRVLKSAIVVDVSQQCETFVPDERRKTRRYNRQWRKSISHNKLLWFSKSVKKLGLANAWVTKNRDKLFVTSFWYK